MGQAVPHLLLRLRWKVVEAGFVLKGLLLLIHRQVAVMLHPLLQMRIGRLLRGRPSSRSRRRMIRRPRHQVVVRRPARQVPQSTTTSAAATHTRIGDSSLMNYERAVLL